MLSAFFQDVRFGLRLLIKDRSFTLTALVTLAICIGANTAIFSVVRSVLLRPLPVPAADRIVTLYNSYPNAGAPRASNGVPDYFDRLEAMTAFDEQALYRRQGVTFGAKAGAQRLTAVRGTPSFFRLVGVAPVAGRVFTEAEGQEGGDRKVLLGHGFWQREFGGDRAVVGRSVSLSGQPHEVVGVLPPDFRFLWNDVDLYLPAAFTADQKSDDARHSNNWQMIARLKPGATAAQAQQQLDALNARNDDRFPQFRQVLKDAGFRSVVVNLQDDLVREIRPVLYLLWGGVLFVLLIGCVNVANLVLVRSTSRSRELATRYAIGADRLRLARQLLTETTLLAAAGGAIGLTAGSWALGAVSALHLNDLPRGFEVSLDATVIAVVFGLSVLVGLLLGLLPIARLVRVDLNSALREEGRSGTAGRRTALIRRTLATAQVAIAFVLLIGAGLLLASFRAVLRTDPGFDSAGVMTAAVGLQPATYTNDAAIATMVDRLLGEVRALPGVAQAGVTDVLPMAGDFNSSVILAEGYVMKPGESLISPARTAVSAGYFETMGIELVRGRYFDARDTLGGNLAAIVDERLAAKFWPGQDAIGRRLYRPDNPDDLFKIGPDTPFITVVGIVREVQIAGIGTGFQPVGAYYFPFNQAVNRGFAIVVRAAGGTDPASLVPALRKTMGTIDAGLPLYDVQSMADRVDSSLVPRRVPMLVAAAFGVVALFLSAIGIYGVLAYGVVERRREIGIRLALGSTGREVFGLVLADGVKIVGVGLALGLAGAFGLAGAIERLLYGVRPMDSTVIGIVAGTLTVVALGAVLIPARRAAKVDPSVALTE